MKGLSEIYDFFSANLTVRRCSLAILIAAFVALVSTLHFSEDISDFLPVGTREKEQMTIYRNISGADRLFILFSGVDDPQCTMDAIDSFVEDVHERDAGNWCADLSGQFDTESIHLVSQYVYDNAPYFLTDSDIARMDSLLASPGYIGSRLEADKRMLLFPSSSFVTENIAHDPLGLFTPVMKRLETSSDSQMFELVDGYIFAPDMSRAVVMMTSPFGSSETENNSHLMGLLEASADITMDAFPGLAIDIVGGPAIAVGNSTRIKKDSVIAIALSVVLIVLLLVYSFRSFRNILLIFISVGWGLLFALGGMAVFRDHVSIIVIGISSIILGIAVNYPLHLIAHTVSQPARKKALKEIVSPLVIGNITTVGAFLALVPLKSTALRDLGLFASLLLIGTILFVLLYLPHYISTGMSFRTNHRLIDRVAAFSPEKNRVVVAAVVLITLILSFFSLNTGFDADMSHINYMTEHQRKDMQYFEDLLTKDTSHVAQTLYVFSPGKTADDALLGMERLNALTDSIVGQGKAAKQNEATTFIVSMQEQRRRLSRWNAFVERHKEELTSGLSLAASRAGFSANAFNRFFSMIERSEEFGPMGMEGFRQLTETVFFQNFTHSDNGEVVYVVEALNVIPGQMEDVRQCLGDNCFDVAGMNSAMTRTLSDNFNYIGWACSLIVFFFLWFSLGRLELALISFLPMAVSWVWILGLMSVLDIQFNIVNVILATFIFGQGDDYTIFMTEGCQYEYTFHLPILQSYKSSILQSAAIMLVGIGTLIVAQHPAMHSLAEVTIIGMSAVVMMAWLIPPLLFRWITTKNGITRKYPLTVRSLLFGAPDSLQSVVMGRYIYKGKDIEHSVRRTLRKKSAEILSSELPAQTVFEYTDEGYGELSLLYALSHPETEVVSHISNEEKRTVARIAAEDCVTNLKFTI